VTPAPHAKSSDDKPTLVAMVQLNKSPLDPESDGAGKGVETEQAQQQHEAEALRPVKDEDWLLHEEDECDTAATLVNNALKDAAPRNMLGLLAQARLGLLHVQKKKEYRSEVIFACLVNLYCWLISG
jgi:hypothetical protein